MKKISLGIVFLVSLFFHYATAQNLSPHLRISILTCAPGEELYTTFGHTAIRVTDSAQHSDLVYNYGMFDFNDPGFYTKFANGKLDYYLAAFGLADFMYEYQSEKRDVVDQELRLTDSEKLSIVKALNDNLAGPDRFYKYDFLYNNCTSRVRDLLVKYAGFKADQVLVPPKFTFRDMLHEYLDKGAKPWSKLGIDLLIGLPGDKKVDASFSMFLPDYLMKGIDSSVKSNNGGILLEKKYLNKGVPMTEPNYNWPLFVLGLFAIIIIGISFFENAKAVSFIKGIDFVLFFITGLIGCLLMWLWFASDRPQYRYNFNLLWALPTHAAAAFALWKRPGWLKKYFSICAVIYAATILCWFFLPQQMNIGFLPLAVLFLQRCLQLRKR